jgi:hypothetical protein
MNARKEVQEYSKRAIERVIMDKFKDDDMMVIKLFSFEF